MDEKQMEKMFEIEDHELSSGFMGFWSNGSKGVNYDKILVTPIDVIVNE